MIWAYTSPFSKTMRSYKYFPYASKTSTLTYNRTNSVVIKNAIFLNSVVLKNAIFLNSVVIKNATF